MKGTLSIPQELINKSILIEDIFPCLLSKDFVSSIPFIHEVHFYNQLDTFKPWDSENLKVSMEEIFQEWKQLKPQLEIDIKGKEKDRLKAGITKAVQYFIEGIYWVNEQPVHIKDGLQLNKLAIKPFNMEDRLSFIMKRLDGYHSYRQLDELFKELEKQYSIKPIRISRLKQSP
ncbi:YpoC family protein [Bacillus sp. B1-b2]|uniref:YpoC family protein n=1 Tax=Bacillus sp. B1-b2 TaxID=2653201 RepID=UPI0012620889|nr:hypothetical protein [Bacillus sp. B1-b2]KAB7672960.1 hypothetical protein F9279_00610 [Bacillus sp. B1-b2]